MNMTMKVKYYKNMCIFLTNDAFKVMNINNLEMFYENNLGILASNHHICPH